VGHDAVQPEAGKEQRHTREKRDQPRIECLREVVIRDALFHRGDAINRHVRVDRGDHGADGFLEAQR
jgi:hypothetical protein